MDHLIKTYLDLSRQQMDIALKMAEIKTELSEHFPCRHTHEVLRTQSGEVHRTVENDLTIPGQYEPQVRKILGDQFIDLIFESVDQHPSPKLRSMLFDADSPLGMALRPYVMVEQTVRIRIIPPVSSTEVTKSGAIIEVPS